MRFVAASILWCIGALAQTPAFNPDDKCSVEGTVVDSATGEPVKKARVTLEPAASPAGAYGTVTDSSGHFVIDDVDAGRFTLTASHPRYIAPTSPHRSQKSGAAIDLQKGQKLAEQVVKLAPEGVISGRILDQDGDTADGASVECLILHYVHGKRRWVVSHRTNTNEIGEFRLAQLEAGRYVIRVEYFEETVAHERPAHGGQASKERYVTTYYPSTSNAGNASPIEVSPGAQIGGITVAVARTRVVKVKGRLNRLAEKGSQRSAVSLWQQEDLALRPRQRVDVDSQGRFEIDDVTPGSYVLLAGDEHSNARLPLEVHEENVEGLNYRHSRTVRSWSSRLSRETTIRRTRRGILHSRRGLGRDEDFVNHRMARLAGFRTSACRARLTFSRGTRRQSLT